MMGTHPHEWFMFHGAQFGYKHANYMALENWVNVYDGDLGIALSDTYTSGIFLSNLSRKQAKLFDGVRCDSGNEFDFIDKLVARYKELGIDATTKLSSSATLSTSRRHWKFKNTARRRFAVPSESVPI